MGILKGLKKSATKSALSLKRLSARKGNDVPVSTFVPNRNSVDKSRCSVSFDFEPQEFPGHNSDDLYDHPEESCSPSTTYIAKEAASIAREWSSGSCAESSPSYGKTVEFDRSSTRLSCVRGPSIADSTMSSDSASDTFDEGTSGRPSENGSSFGPGLGTPVGIPQRVSPSKVATHAAARSSFALERQSLEANRASLKKFGGNFRLSISGEEDMSLPGDVDALCAMYGIPPMLRDRYLKLAVLPANTPVPMRTLRMLWRCQDLAATEGTAYLMQSSEILQMATIDSGDMWCLVQPPHLKALQHASRQSVHQLHRVLLVEYLRVSGVEHYADIEDDGYIVNNLGYHLVGAQKMSELRDLLLNPAWLEMKLHAYGMGSVVADFRRYLMVDDHPEVKLILEAFQMSIASCEKCPALSMLGSQMAARLMTVQNSEFVRDWCEFQRQLAQEMVEEAEDDTVKALWTRSASLDQAGGLLRMTLRGHMAAVTHVRLAPSGVEVVTGSEDGTLRLWDMDVGDCVLLLEGHTGAITSIDITAAGDFLLSGSTDGTARLWELERGQCERHLNCHNAEVRQVKVDPLGRFALTVSSDGTGRVWELAAGTCVHQLKGQGSIGGAGIPHSVALSPDSRTCVTAGNDYTARVWDLAKGICTRDLVGHTSWVVDVAITPDGCKAVTASHDGTAIIWDLWSGAKEKVLSGHSGRISRLVVSYDGQIVVTVSDDQTARVFSVRTGEMKWELKGHSAWVNDAALTEHGGLCVTAAADKLGLVWDLYRGECVRVLEGHSSEVHAVSLTRKGRFAVTGCQDGTARVWDLHAPKTATMEVHEGRVHSVRVAPDGRTAVSAGEDGCVRVWDVSSGTCRGSCKVGGEEGSTQPLRWLEMSVDGRLAMTATGNRAINIWDLDSLSLHSRWQGEPGSRLKSFSASPDGGVGVLSLWDSTVMVQCLSGGQRLHTLQARGMDPSKAHRGGINGVRVAPKGNTAVTYSKDATARVWDLASGECLRVLGGHSDAVVAVDFSGDASLLVTTSYDCTSRVWALDSGRCLHTWEHQQPPSHVSMSGDGSRCITWGGDGQPHLWDVAGQCEVAQLNAHTDEVVGCCFSPDGQFAASVSTDCTAAVWRTADGGQEAFFMADGALSCCQFGIAQEPEPHRVLVVGTTSGTMHFLSWD